MQNQHALTKHEAEAIMRLSLDRDGWSKYTEYLKRQYQLALSDMESYLHDLAAYRHLQGKCEVYRKLIELETTVQSFHST